MDDRDQIEAIKEALDIVSVVQSYVPNLKRSGRNYFGPCPFHKEKTPSFSVNPELKLFKCFGCGEGGDVIKFLQKIEGLDFPKALQLAADKAGIVLKRTFSATDQKRDLEKERLLEANLLAARYYNFLLLKHDLGGAGRVYARKRELRKEEIEQFLIGYAPAGFENLKHFLVKKGFRLNELVNWGLLVSKNGRIYDKFRNRLMFTIFDHQGDVVGFSGRLIADEAMGPKYLNSPETLVYKKSRMLYGLYQGKDAIRREKAAVLVEGNVDILSSHRVGITNIVAPLGTALTSEQVKLLKRYCDAVYFALDTDAAGQHALEKDLVLLGESGLRSYVLELGAYKDVDELIVKGGDWKAVVANPLEVVPYLINTLAKGYDLTKAFAKTEYIRRILQYILSTQDQILQTDYLQRLQEVAGIDMSILRNELNRMSKAKPESKQEQLAGLVDLSKVKEKESLSKYLLALISEHRRFRSSIKPEVKEWVSDEYKLVYKAIWEPNLTKNFTLSAQEIYEEISLMQVPIFDDEEKFLRELRQVLQRIKKEVIKAELDALRFTKDDDNLNRLQELSKELNKLDLVQ